MYIKLSCVFYNLQITEFNAKMREKFPKKPSVGRTEFKTLKELADYLESEDRKVEQQRRRRAHGTHETPAQSGTRTD